MKKLIAILLVLLMIAPSALALDLTVFNMYVGFFGGKELSNGTVRESENGVFTWFKVEGGQVGFHEVNGELESIAIYGNDGEFITYCCAAMMTVDKDATHAVENFGNFTFLLQMHKGDAPGAESRMFGLANGTSPCEISKDDKFGFRMLVVK